MGEFEALADAVTGGVLSRAVEPKAGEGAGHTHESSCLNCGAPLTGPYCSACGQHAHVHRTLSAFFHDFAHGVLHFEGKIWRTLPLLAWRPGELTRRYIEGQRASFVSPIALFLFCVFLTFAVMGMAGMTSPNLENGGLAKAERENAGEIADLQKKRSEAVAKGQPTASIDKQIAEDQQGLETLRSLRAKGLPPGVSQTKPAFRTDIPWLADAVKKAKNNPDLLFYKLKTDAYKYSWALIPISVPFVWLLFPFSRRFRLYDHIVFVTYSLCFMMLLLTTGTLVGLVSTSVATIGWFVPPVHMYRQLRGAYGVSRFGAVWRTIALTIFAFIAIAFFATLLVTLGAMD
jgi:Protein of unknown function (DUF3667).